MDNLFVESFCAYLQKECDAGLAKGSRPEVRLFTTTFPPDVLFQAFERLENHLIAKRPNAELRIKVGKPLWDYWQRAHAGDPTLKQFMVHDWVDLDDRLTYFRNLKCEAPHDALVIVLAGVDRVLDKGGLADFHVVSERSIWERQLKRSYEPWLRTFLTGLGLDPSDGVISEACEFFEQLYRYNTQDLVHLSRFFEEACRQSAGIDSESAFFEYLYRSLGEWGIPPMFGSSKKRKRLFPLAVRFIRYTDYMKAADRKRALGKIDLFERRLADGEIAFSLPENLQGLCPLGTVEDYLEVVRRYVGRNDAQARETLLQLDCIPLLEQILTIKSTGQVSKSPSVKKVRGPALQAMLRALWDSLVSFKRAAKGRWAATLLEGVTIEFTGFAHDLEADDTTERHAAARKLLQGLLGGLAKTLELPLEFRSEDGSVESSFTIQTSLDFETINFRAIRSADPFVEFRIVLKAQDEDLNLENRYRWIVPEVHEERVLVNFAQRVLAELDKLGGTVLPVFHLDTYNELFLAADADEANRLLGLSETGFKVENLLTPEITKRLHQEQSSLFDSIADVCRSYYFLLQDLVEHGCFYMLSSRLTSFLQAYSDLLETLTRSPALADSDVGYLIYKAFLIIPKKVGGKVFDKFERYLPSAIVLGITPAVLEIVQARETYLVSAFPALVAKILEQAPGKADFEEFEVLLGMVEIHRPIVGLIKDSHKLFSTHKRSLGLIHCLGEPQEETLSLASQAIMQEETADDADLAGSELFAPSQEAKIYSRILLDYVRLHPHAEDGLTVLAIDVDDLQALIAGVHRFLDALLEERPTENAPYQFSLKIYCKNSSAQSMQKWLSAWRNQWDPSRGLATYPNCQIAIAHRQVSRIEDYGKVLREETDAIDVAFLVRFMRANEGGDELEATSQPFHFDKSDSGALKFPIIEAPRPPAESIAERSKRQTILSNRRLRIPTLHAELSAKLKFPNNSNSNHLVVATVDYSNWAALVDQLHKKGRADWVACIDPYIDKGLIQQRADSDQTSREIVGFSSGLGAYGELNVTVSTESNTLSQLADQFARRLRETFETWEAPSAQQAAQNLIHEAQRLAGLSLVKATGHSEYVRDVAAYSIVRKSLPPAPGAFCDELLSLDSFRHWFQEGYVPDLLRLVAYLDGARLRIEATVIECKLAHANIVHVNKAVAQVEAGLISLSRSFLPKGLGDVRAQYSRRFWWAQLQRAIAAHARLPIAKKEGITLALEDLCEGFFTIGWKGAVITFWTDKETAAVQIDKLVERPRLGAEPADYPQSFGIYHLECGSSVTKQLCLGAGLLEIPGEPVVFRPDDGGLGPKSVDVEVVLPKNPEPTPKQEPASGDPSSLALSASIPVAPLPPTPVKAEVGSLTTTAVEPAIVPSPKPSPAAAVSIGCASEPPQPPIIPSGQAIPPVQRSVPPRVLLGSTAQDKRIYWEFGHPELTNRHLLIFGRSGVGKTYAIQALLSELARQSQNAVIVDYTDGFLSKRLEPGFKDVASPKSYLVRKEPLPINPLRRQTTIFEDLDEVIEENPHETAMRVMSVFDSVYRLGDQQKSMIVSAIKMAFEQYGNDLNLKHVMAALSHGNGPSANSGLTLANKIMPFVEGAPFGQEDPESWRRFYDDDKSRVHILQLATVSREFARIITEFILWDLYYFGVNHGSVKYPMPVVLDEVQNLSHALDAPLAKILTEGRKFGLAAILATQTMSNLRAEEQDRLFQAAHKLFFAPAETEVKEYATLLAATTSTPTDEWIRRLSELKKGECWSLGPSLDDSGQLKLRPFKIRITPFELRDAEA